MKKPLAHGPALALLLMAMAPALAACSSPEPRLYTLQTTEGRTLTDGPRLLLLRQVSLARYLQRSQIVRSSADYELKVEGNEWWGEPLGAMIGRVLQQDLTQRLPGTQVFNDAGTISPDANWQVEVNLLQMDASQPGVLVLRAQIAVSAKEGEPKTESERFEQHIAGPSVADQVSAGSQALGKLAGAIAALVVSQVQAHPAEAPSPVPRATLRRRGRST